MSMVHAILLGMLQSLTDFLPVSSYGHLAIARHFWAGFGQQDVLFDMLLHVGTILAVVIVFHCEVWQLARASFVYGKEARAGRRMRLPVLPVVCGFLVLCIVMPVTAQGVMTDTAFFRLCVKGTVEEVSEALYSGANINAQDAQGMTALMYAAKDNADPAVMRVLLIAAAEFQEKGLLQGWRGGLRSKTVDVNDKNHEGMTALMFAVENNSPKVVQVLLNAGADANARDNQDMTVLMRAVVKKSSKEMIIMLLDDGADANAKTKEDVTALMFAVEDNSPDVVQVLLDAGADANAKDKQKKTVLMRAMKRKSSPEVVKMLLGAGADVNAQDEKKRTALVYAARYSDLEMLKILVDAGADVRAVENGQIVRELEKRINP